MDETKVGRKGIQALCHAVPNGNWWCDHKVVTPGLGVTRCDASIRELDGEHVVRRVRLNPLITLAFIHTFLTAKVANQSEDVALGRQG